eukprot:TRINITY_DN6149_c0_g1_i5.p1 TRINITY_DN6149_c0_g1~~TRINITY_DN6149_c0_g1_i5.p1  ORF type:complete len:509 (+),score=110.60 TRINITY_DN6149_c0_g1_i5:47-1528(+)
MANPNPTPQNSVGELKSSDYRKKFSLPEAEELMFSCLVAWKSTFPVEGYLYVSQSYVCFGSVIGSTNEVIPFSKILEIRKDTTLFLLPDSISFDVEGGKKYTFAFGVMGMYRAKCFNICVYLWKNPISYMKLRGSVPVPVSKNVLNSIKDLVFSEKGSSSEGNKQQLLNPDTSSTASILKMANETREMGFDTMSVLDKQGEKLDRIDQKLEDIDANLDKAEIILKKMKLREKWIPEKIIEGMTYQVINPIKGPQHVGGSIPEKAVADSKKEKSPIEGPYVDVEILRKLGGGTLAVSNLEPVRLRLGKDEFGYIAYDKSQLVSDSLRWHYTGIQKIIIRSKPMHMYIHFVTGDRISLVSSYLQLITNEIVAHCAEKQKKVIGVEFEAGAPRFDYGDPRLSLVPNPNAKAKQTSGGIKTSDLLGPNVSKELKDKLDKSDAELDDLFDVVGDIDHIAKSMSQTLDKHNEKLGHIEENVDKVNHKMKRNVEATKQLL